MVTRGFVVHRGCSQAMFYRVLSRVYLVPLCCRTEGPVAGGLG